jgi:hypothetical protein
MGLHFLLILVLVLALLTGGGAPCGSSAPLAACSTASCPICGLDDASGCGPGTQCCCTVGPDKSPASPQMPILPDAPRIMLGLPLEPIRLAAELPVRHVASSAPLRSRSSERSVRTLYCVWLT